MLSRRVFRDVVSWAVLIRRRPIGRVRSRGVLVRALLVTGRPAEELVLGATEEVASGLVPGRRPLFGCGAARRLFTRRVLPARPLVGALLAGALLAGTLAVRVLARNVVAGDVLTGRALTRGRPGGCGLAGAGTAGVERVLADEFGPWGGWSG